MFKSSFFDELNIISPLYSGFYWLKGNIKYKKLNSKLIIIKIT